MSFRGSERTEVRDEDGAVLAVARDLWEMQPEMAGETLVALRESCAVVADATLYYVRDLEHRLRGAGVAPRSRAASDLIAAAYEAFGDRCVEHLEGDFAFCVWDRRRREIFCARDPFGSRSLYHMGWDGGFFVASTAHPLARLSGGGPGFDPRRVLRALLMAPGDGRSTAWAHIDELPAAHTLAQGRGGPTIARFWNARPSQEYARLDESEAVREAARLLAESTRERHRGVATALALSGGQDSTAVLASSVPGEDPPLDLISLRMPEGDVGDESWYVELVARQYARPVHWLNAVDLPMLEDLVGGAEIRSQCLGHMFESHNRALAATARTLGDRVLLNGHGGDNVFGVLDWEMADLLRAGRLLALRRYMRSRRYRGVRPFLRHCVRPAMPYWTLDLLEVALGRRICSRPWEQPVPEWIVADEAQVKDIVRADRETYRRDIVRVQPTVTLRMRAWGLVDSAFQRGCALLYDMTRDEGVELRMPFYDRRLIEFALSRSASEFNQPRQIKVMLQRAMAGRLPERDRQLLPGSLKPGTSGGLLERRWRPGVAAFLEMVSGGPWATEELGLVDPLRFRNALRHTGDRKALSHAGVDLGLTMFTEAWLRRHSGQRP